MTRTPGIGDAAVGDALYRMAYRMAADGRPDLQTIADADGIDRFVSAAGLEPFGLDDFGTGSSSLSYRRMFPLDFVRIDRFFIHGLVAGTTQHAIVASLVDRGCDRAQGFHDAPPGPGELIEHRVLGTAPPSASTDHRRATRTEQAAHV